MRLFFSFKCNSLEMHSWLQLLYSALMYSHRDDRKRVDCVDLDPYGTAAPFIDAAVQCVQDGGMRLSMMIVPFSH